jgi:hypothetical protein
MSTQAAAFVRAYLGRAADCSPSPDVAAALRHHLLTDDLKNPLDCGAQSSPRNVPGLWPDAYAVFHEVVSAEQLAPRWDKWIEMESLRGLPDGPLLPKITNVYKVTHFTVTQHWLISALHPDPAQAKLSRRQAVALRDLVLKDSLITQPGTAIASRAPGWVGQALRLDYLATLSLDPIAAGVAALTAKVTQTKGAIGDVPHLWPNPNAVKDKNHLYPNAPWMDSTIGGWVSAWTMKDLILHWLRCVAFAQRDDGTFHDDYGLDAAGVFGYHEAPGESTETFIWPALVAAKEALDDDWPAWAQALMDRCKSRWGALNRFRPGDSGFRDAHNQSIAIAVAPEWGWRS